MRVAQVNSELAGLGPDSEHQRTSLSTIHTIQRGVPNQLPFQSSRITESPVWPRDNRGQCGYAAANEPKPSHSKEIGSSRVEHRISGGSTDSSLASIILNQNKAQSRGPAPPASEHELPPSDPDPLNMRCLQTNPRGCQAQPRRTEGKVEQHFRAEGKVDAELLDRIPGVIWESVAAANAALAWRSARA
ncbi:hypothetical protein AOLI_G00321650 [Acnodon oligacanthus]